MCFLRIEVDVVCVMKVSEWEWNRNVAFDEEWMSLIQIDEFLCEFAMNWWEFLRWIWVKGINNEFWWINDELVILISHFLCDEFVWRA